jgi:hypothetical protein
VLAEVDRIERLTLGPGDLGPLQDLELVAVGARDVVPALIGLLELARDLGAALETSAC